MSRTTILITGGSGFLGALTARRILHQGPDQTIVMTDIAHHPRIALLAGKVAFVSADLSDPRACLDLLTPDTSAVYHFASLVSGGAERDFVAGFNANVRATVNLLEACREKGACPRFFFASSIATFGGERLPKIVDDWSHQHPQSSYGVAKVLGEQLLNDYSRKGYVDGRAMRLPAIVVRDEPNTAASGYTSALIREPLCGRAYGCPVPSSTRIPILNWGACIELIVTLMELPAGALGDFRTVNCPNISPTAREIANAVRRRKQQGTGKISFEPDPSVAGMIATWPRQMLTKRAAGLGLKASVTIDTIIDEYLQNASGNA
jgi:nucleoside-diphosphate-sugar epimerase